MSRREIQLVVLDLAGTVLDFGCQAPSGAFVEAFRQCHVTVSTAEARQPMGLHKKDHLRAMLQVTEIGERWKQHYQRDWTENDVQQMYEMVTPMQVAAVKVHRQLIPGAVACYQGLRELGIKIAVSTGYFTEAAELCYEALRSQGFTPDFAICADDVPAGRPAPWMIFRAMEALNVYPPSAVLKVGDTIIDIADGRNAGTWSLGVVDSSNEMGLSFAEFEALSEPERKQRREGVAMRYQQAQAHGVIEGIGNLPAYIEQIQQGNVEFSSL